MTKNYELCPFCNHKSWHKTFGCNDTCCSGCNEDMGGYDCDCQAVIADIKEENERLKNEKSIT